MSSADDLEDSVVPLVIMTTLPLGVWPAVLAFLVAVVLLFSAVQLS